MNMTYEEIIEALETAIKIGDAPIGKNFACTISKLTAREALNLLKWQNAEINHYKINLPYLEHQNEDFCGVPCKFMEDLIKKKVDESAEKMQAEIKRLNTALDIALKFNSNAETDKRLANMELARANSVIEDLRHEIRNLECEKGQLEGTIECLVEQAKIEAIKEFAERVKARAILPIGTLYGKMVYIKDIDNLLKEMVGDAE